MLEEAGVVAGDVVDFAPPLDPLLPSPLVEVLPAASLSGVTVSPELIASSVFPFSAWPDDTAFFAFVPALVVVTFSVSLFFPFAFWLSFPHFVRLIARMMIRITTKARMIHYSS